MLRDRLRSLRQPRAYSRVWLRNLSRHPARAVFHLFLIGLTALAALLTAHLVTDAEPAPVLSIPPAPLSGVRAIAPTGETLLRPGVSHETVASPLRASLPAPDTERWLREDVTESVAEVSAASAEVGCGQQALSDQIDPRAPYILYEVKSGDTLGAIAESCKTTVDNILLNNAEVDAGGWIAPGEQILVPRSPVPGILYKVGYGDTLQSIIDDYLNVTVQDVIDHRPNNLSGGGDIEVGSYVLLPRAEPKPPPSMSPEGYVITPPPPVASGRFGLPLAAWGFISDYFGTDRGGGRIHTGIDLALGAYPASAVYAACDGRVTRVEWLTYSYGYYVIVDCGDGWSTLYSHFREIIVSWGEYVRKGETVLGISGSTGYSTGEHLHFEIRHEGRPLNPQDYLQFPYALHP